MPYGEPALTFTDSVKGNTSQPVVDIDDRIGFAGSGQEVIPFARDLWKTW